MHPVLFEFEVAGVSRPIGSYGAALCAALLVGSTLYLRAAMRRRLDPGACVALLGCTVAGTFLGASTLHMLVRWVVTGSLRTALASPGLVFFGGALGGTATLCMASRRLGLSPGVVADAAVPAIPVAHAIGRCGCFLGGCCYGCPWDGPFAVLVHGGWRHPWPLYEACALLLLAAVFARTGRGHDGVRFAGYFAAYACLRMSLEILRGDAVRGTFFDGWISTSQLISLAVLTVAGGFVVHRLPWPARSLSSS